jgi:hypothetical protein
MTDEEIDPHVPQEHDVETLVLSLLRLAEVAEDLVEEQRAKLRELSERLDNSGANLFDINDAMRLALLSHVRLSHSRESYLLDFSPLLQEMSSADDRPSHGIEALGPSLAALTNVTRNALNDPVAFAQSESLLARLAARVGLTWPRTSE